MSKTVTTKTQCFCPTMTMFCASMLKRLPLRTLDTTSMLTSLWSCLAMVFLEREQMSRRSLSSLLTSLLQRCGVSGQTAGVACLSQAMRLMLVQRLGCHALVAGSSLSQLDVLNSECFLASDYKLERQLFKPVLRCRLVFSCVVACVFVHPAVPTADVIALNE